MNEKICPDCTKEDGRKKLKHIIFWAFKEFGEHTAQKPQIKDEDLPNEIVGFIEKFVDKNF